jgi:hypothetical protein
MQMPSICLSTYNIKHYMICVPVHSYVCVSLLVPVGKAHMCIYSCFVLPPFVEYTSTWWADLSLFLWEWMDFSKQLASYTYVSSITVLLSTILVKLENTVILVSVVHAVWFLYCMPKITPAFIF